MKWHIFCPSTSALALCLTAAAGAQDQTGSSSVISAQCIDAGPIQSAFA